MSLSPHMVKLLHVARSKVAMDEETYRAMLGGYGAKSSKDTCLQPKHYHEMLAKMGFKPALPKAARVPGRATGAQVYKIREYEKALGWAEAPARLRGFLEKWYRTSDPKFLTSRQAWRAVESLKHILAKMEGGKDGPKDAAAV